MGLGGFPGTHPLFVGMPGMHGIAAATYAFQESDAILAVGVRFDERVLSTVMSEWAPGAKIIHIDVDPAEISKNRAAHIGIAGQAGPTLAALAEAYRALPEPHDAGRRAAWVERIAAWKRQYPYQVDEDAEHDPAPAGDPGGLPHHPRRGDHLHRRRPAPDVGRPALPLRPAAALDHLGGPRDDGLRPAGGARGPGGAARRAGHRHRRRRLVRDDPAGALDRPDVRPAGQGGDPQQRLPGHGAPVAGALLGGPLRGHELRALPAELRGHRPGLRHPRPRPCTTAGDLEDALAEAFAADGPALVDVHVNPMAKVFPMVPQGKGPDAIIVGSPAAGASA